VRRRLVRAGIPILAKERAALEKAANGEARGRPPAPKPSQAGFRITQSQREFFVHFPVLVESRD
jgi:hypothetical protein